MRSKKGRNRPRLASPPWKTSGPNKLSVWVENIAQRKPNSPFSQDEVERSRNSGCFHLLGLHDQIPQRGWRQQQKRIFSPFWRLEVSDGGVGQQGWLADLLLPVSPCGLPSLGVSLPKYLLPIRTPVILDRAPIMSSFNWITSWKTLLSSTVTVWVAGGGEGFGLQPPSVGGHNSAHNTGSSWDLGVL